MIPMRRSLRRGSPARLTAVDIKAEKLVQYQRLFGGGVRARRMSFGAYLDGGLDTGRCEVSGSPGGGALAEAPAGARQ